MLGFGVSKGQTQVEVCLKDEDAGFAEAWVPIIIGELTESVTRLYQIERSGKYHEKNENIHGNFMYRHAFNAYTGNGTGG
jgi:hypothetical protein